MQVPEGTHGSLPETLYFDHGSSSSDVAIDQQVFWNDSRDPAEGWIPDFMLPPSDANFVHSIGQLGHNLVQGSSGETSSSNSQNEIGCDIPKTDQDQLSSLIPRLEEQYEPTDFLSVDDVDVNFHSNEIANGPLLLRSPHSNDLAQNIAFDARILASGGEDWPIENCHAHETGTALNEQLPCVSSSSDPLESHSRDEKSSFDARPDCSPQSHQRSRKRKAIETFGQSSVDGSSSSQQAAINAWHPASPQRNDGGNLRISRRRRDFSYQDSMHQYLFLGNNHSGHPNVSSSHSPARDLSLNNSIDLRANQPRDEGDGPNSPNEPFVVHVPPIPQNASAFRRNGASSSGPNCCSFSEAWDATLHEAPNPRNILRNIYERPPPMFIPTGVLSNLSQGSVDHNTVGRNANTSGNVASTLRNGSHSSAISLPPNIPSSRYPRRLAEIVRRSLLSAGTESGGQINQSFDSGPSSQGVTLGSVAGGPHESSTTSTSLVGRQVDGIRGFPNTLRNLSVNSDGRIRLLSEIHGALEIMHRGESFRFQEMFLNSYEDRHRDMRLDIDSMSYEELLALEERIGYVNTGLSGETISSELKPFKHSGGSVEMEPCSICREDYEEGDEMRMLDCTHQFHADCIKKWLTMKNECPVCKATALPSNTPH